jgi:RNA-directed DNA polymerase
MVARTSISPIVDGISRHFGISRRDVESIIGGAPRRYKSYYIPKRAGGLRLISQPAREVKALQHWFMARCEGMLKVHAAASAYVRKKGISQNAERHRENEFLLKMDFLDFFPSIRGRDLRRYIAADAPWLLDGEDVEKAVRLLFFSQGPDVELRLSIGAPTSPWLSNLLMFRFDESVSEVCRSREVAYTRYGDDVTFSSNDANSLRAVEEESRDIVAKLESPRLLFNPRKTIMLSRKSQRRVTGLVLSNDGKVSLGRARKRQLRASVHHLILGKLSNEEVVKLRGWLAFARDVEPEFVRRLSGRYGTEMNVVLSKAVGGEG